MSTVFVTASGTEVGKTHVMTLLIAELRRAGFSVRALKPVITGFDAAAPETSDSGRLLLAQGIDPTVEHLDAVSPWRFAAPLSPDMAAAREHREIPFDELVRFCRAPRDVDITLIEGIGGVMVPLGAKHTVLDWIDALGAPALVVVGSYLGTLSHTLTAVGMLTTRGCSIAGIIVNESTEQPVPLPETAAVVERFVAPLAVRTLPQVPPAGSGARDGAGTTDLMSLIEPLLSRAFS